MDVDLKNGTMEFFSNFFEQITPTHMLFLVCIFALYIALVAIKNKK